MRYFEQHVPCQALLGGVPGKGPGAAHGFGVPQRARSEAAGGWVVGLGSGTRCSALASSPSLVAAAAPRPDSEQRSIPLLQGKACLPLPSYDAPCCIATRIRVPSRLPGSATLDPSPVALAGPCGSALAPPAVAASTPPWSAPEPRSALTLTGLRTLLSFTRDFAKTCHQTRASIPGRWFIVCARARRDVPWRRPLPPGPNPLPCAHALNLLNLFSSLSHREKGGIGSSSWERKSLAGKRTEVTISGCRVGKLGF